MQPVSALGRPAQGARLAAAPRLLAQARVVSPASGRSFVSYPVFQALADTDPGASAIKAFKFQAHQYCMANGESLHKAITGDLKERGVLVAGEERHDMAMESDLGASALMEQVEHHGPRRLVMYGIVQPGQGREQYRAHHSVVLAATFKDHGGRDLGVVIDGNDLQRNAAMDAIAQWQTKSGDPRSLDELRAADFEAINQDLRERGVTMDVRQAAFRIVDLEKFAQAGDRAFRKAVQADFRLTYFPPRAYRDAVAVDGELILQPALAALRDAVGKNPDDVEDDFAPVPVAADIPQEAGQTFWSKLTQLLGAGSGER